MQEKWNFFQGGFLSFFQKSEKEINKRYRLEFSPVRLSLTCTLEFSPARLSLALHA
jgi:hypothetical protein